MQVPKDEQSLLGCGENLKKKHMDEGRHYASLATFWLNEHLPQRSTQTKNKREHQASLVTFGRQVLRQTVGEEKTRNTYVRKPLNVWLIASWTTVDTKKREKNHKSRKAWG